MKTGPEEQEQKAPQEISKEAALTWGCAPINSSIQIKIRVVS